MNPDATVLPTVKVSCPQCSQRIEAPPEMIGRQIECPGCNHRFELRQPKRNLPPPGRMHLFAPTKPDAARTVRQAVAAETNARVLNVIALLLLFIGVAVLLQGFGSDKPVEIGWFYWAGAIALVGLLENIIVQLLRIRIALENKD